LRVRSFNHNVMDVRKEGESMWSTILDTLGALAVLASVAVQIALMRKA
jgi:hypothetical protein